jgi:hypothetical protein
MKDQQLKNYVIYLIFGIFLLKEVNVEEEIFGYKGKEIKTAFEEADKEIPNISTSYKKNSDAVYTSRAFYFTNLLSKPVNLSIITSYINEGSNESIFLFPKFIFY